MGIIDAFLTRRRQNIAAMEHRSAGTALVPYTADRPTWLPNTIDTYDEGAYRKAALIFRCVQYIAHAAGQAPMRVYFNKDGEPTPQPDHALRQLLIQPNDSMGESRFFSFVAMLMTVTGFALIEKERNTLDGVMRLWPLRSDWARPIRRTDGTVDWEYKVPGYQDPFLLESEDVIAIPYADTPDFSPVGIGPMSAILREVGITSAMTDFLKVFMDRGAMPLYVMIPSDDGRASAQWKDQGSIDAFRNAFSQRYGGLPRSVEPMPLVGIKDIKPLGLDFNQLAYPDLNKMADARICTGFGIPPILVGTQVGLEHATYSNYGQARRSFYEDTMMPFWGRIDDAFTRHLLPEFETRPGYDVAFDVSDLPALKDDEDAAWKRAIEGFRVGMISRHMGQRVAGVEAHGPDEFFVTAANPATPLDEKLGRSTSVTALVEALRLTESARSRFMDATGYVRALPDLKAPRFVYRDGGFYVNEARLTPAQRQHRAAITATNQQAIGELADKIAPDIERFLGEQKDRILSGLNLRHNMSMLEVRIADVWEPEDAELLRIFAQWWTGVTDTARNQAEDLIGVDIAWNVVNPYIADLQGVLAQRVVGINRQTQTDIEDTIARLMSEGTTVPEMGAAIEGLFDISYKNRHIAVARTESMMGYGVASVDAYAASGLVDRAQLHDNPLHTDSYGASDGLTCAQRNGRVVPLSQVQQHLNAEHPNGTMSVSPVLSVPLGEV